LKQVAPLFVFVQHYARWSAVAREAVRFHKWKQAFFLFGMMAVVGEVPQEIDRVAGGLGIKLLGPASFDRHFLQTFQHLFDHLMFFSQDFSSSH
jgi:hypothetical protein